MLAALSVVFDLWPRLGLAACWLLLCSFVAPTLDLSPTIEDRLLLESTLVAIPFAPAGLRPGLGRSSPPSPWATLFARYLALRVLFESGYGKLVGYGGQWRSLEFMTWMHQNTPHPTYLGFLDHCLPHAWHVFETGFTLVAELGAVGLLFLGRRPRILAALIFEVLQLGIWLTCNFAWLNPLSMGIGLLLLDDGALAPLGALEGQVGPRRAEPAWKRVTWVGLWAANAGCGTALLLLLLADGARPQESAWTRSLLAIPFRPAGRYTPFSKQYPARFLVEFAGTGDRGESWKPYTYELVQQSETGMARWFAPYRPRLDAAIQKFGMEEDHRPIFRSVARHLLAGDPLAVSLFQEDPFEGRKPQAIRMMVFRMSMNDWDTYRDTGRFWHREFIQDFEPMLIAGGG